MISLLPSDNDTTGPVRDGFGKVSYILRGGPLLDSAGTERLEMPIVQDSRALSFQDNRAIHFRFQESANWFTPSGVARKRKMIEAKGLPDMRSRRFVTLTLDPAEFDYDPLLAYLAGKDKIRRWMFACREAGLWSATAWWCWKLEFTREGWAHWHLVIDRKRKFSLGEMTKISALWGLGRVNCRRISGSEFGYQFKYAFKGVYQDDDSGLSLPAWFLDHYQEAADGLKPESFARVRFWQTSKGFYTGEKVPSPPAKEKQTSIRVRTVRELLESRRDSVVVIARNRRGDYLKSKSIRLHGGFPNFYRHHEWASDHGRAYTLSSRSYLIDSQTAQKTTNKTDIWQLHQILSTNRLTLRKARSLRFSMINLHHS